jgi:hypothetical protein
MATDANACEDHAAAEASEPRAEVDALADQGQEAAANDVVVVEAAANQDAQLDGGIQADATRCVEGARWGDPDTLCCNSATQYYVFNCATLGCHAYCEDFGVGCPTSHTCACVLGLHQYYGAVCSEDEARDVIQFVNPCYGAPSARLERLASAARSERVDGVS